MSRASLFSRVEALSTKLSQSQIYMTCVYSKLCVFIVSGMPVTLWDQLMLDVRSSSLCRWFYEILVTWTVNGKKTCEELCTLHSTIWSAWDGKEYNWTQGLVCRIKICDLPQTRLAVFLLHTSARNTKTPCWNFHCWYSKLGFLDRKSSKKKDWDVDIIFIKRIMKNELKWTSSLGTERVLHVKKKQFLKTEHWDFFLQINDSHSVRPQCFFVCFGTLPYAVFFNWTKPVDKLAVKRFAMSSNTL